MYRKNVPISKGFLVVFSKRPKSKSKKAGSFGQNRNGKSGPKAVVYKDGKKIETVIGSTFRTLTRELRKKYDIHQRITFSKKVKEVKF